MQTLSSHLIASYPHHRICKRGSTWHAIPVADKHPHRCHHKCYCKPSHDLKTDGPNAWSGLWIHKALDTTTPQDTKRP